MNEVEQMKEVADKKSIELVRILKLNLNGRKRPTHKSPVFHRRVRRWRRNSIKQLRIWQQGIQFKFELNDSQAQEARLKGLINKSTKILKENVTQNSQLRLECLKWSHCDSREREEPASRPDC